MKISLDWAHFKTHVVQGGLPYKYLDFDETYYVYARDGNFIFETAIPQDGQADHQDFEANFKDTSFTTFTQLDADGANIVRIKAAKRGWSFWAVPVEIMSIIHI